MSRAETIDLESYVERQLRACAFLPLQSKATKAESRSFSEGEFEHLPEPSKAGVYVIHTVSGQVLTVGKARCLRRKLISLHSLVYVQSPSLWQFLFGFFKSQDIELRYRFMAIESEIERRTILHLLKKQLDPLYEKVEAKFGKKPPARNGETAEYRELRKAFRYSAALRVLKDHGFSGAVRVAETDSTGNLPE